MKVLHYSTASDPSMYIVNGWIYFYMVDSYLDEGKGRDIYKMRTDGTEFQLALEDKTYDFTVAGYWIYYLVKTKENESYKIYKAKLDGTGRQKIAEDINTDIYFGLNVAEDWIYYLVATNKEEIYDFYKTKTDGTGYQKIAEKIRVSFGKLNVVGDWIFYESAINALCRMKTDGTNKEIIE